VPGPDEDEIWPDAVVHKKLIFLALVHASPTHIRTQTDYRGLISGPILGMGLMLQYQ